MFYLTCCYKKYITDYKNIIEIFNKNNIPYVIFASSETYENLKKFNANVVKIPFKVPPWIKDYLPQIFLPTKNFRSKGILISYLYKPPYLKKINSAIDTFISFFKRNYIASQNIICIDSPIPLDGGALVNVYVDKKILILKASEWPEDKLLPSLSACLDLTIKQISVKSNNKFFHLDSVFNIFPSRKNDKTFCILTLKDKLTSQALSYILSTIRSFLYYETYCFKFDVDNPQILDYRHISATLNGIVFNGIYFYPSFTGMPYPTDFITFLETHGYKAVPIYIDNLLKDGGGLACITWNGWFLSSF